MFKPEITSHSDHGAAAQSIYIPGHGTYDVRTDTLALVTEHLAHLSVRELRSRMTRACLHTEGIKAELGGVRRAELLFIATEYPTIYLPGMVQALGLKCDSEGRYWVPPTPEAEAPAYSRKIPEARRLGAAQRLADAQAGYVSPFVADPANPTDDELAAAIQRGMADGSIITAEEFLARARDAETRETIREMLNDWVKAGREVVAVAVAKAEQAAQERAGRDDSDRCGVCHRDAHRPGTGHQGHPYVDPQSRTFRRTINLPVSSTVQQLRRAQVGMFVRVPGAIGWAQVEIVAKSRCGLAFIGDDGRERPVADILL